MSTEIMDDVHDGTRERRESEKRYRVFLCTRGRQPCSTPGSGADSGVYDAIDEIGVRAEWLVIKHGTVDHIGGFDAMVDRDGVETESVP